MTQTPWHTKSSSKMGCTHSKVHALFHSLSFSLPLSLLEFSPLPSLSLSHTHTYIWTTLSLPLSLSLSHTHKHTTGPKSCSSGLTVMLEDPDGGARQLGSQDNGGMIMFIANNEATLKDEREMGTNVCALTHEHETASREAGYKKRTRLFSPCQLVQAD